MFDSVLQRQGQQLTLDCENNNKLTDGEDHLKRVR